MPQLKNRYVGDLTVKFPDGYTEKCRIREKTSKGAGHFIETVHLRFQNILESAVEAFPQIEQTESNIKKAAEIQKNGLKLVSYHGDFHKELLTVLLPPELRETADFGELK
ncbi:Uncharacterised protein [uncultured archaeon]|nr:Uncharacterised protein [uncultured archaeon]